MWNTPMTWDDLGYVVSRHDDLSACKLPGDARDIVSA